MKTQYTPEELKTLEPFDSQKMRAGRTPVMRNGGVVSKLTGITIGWVVDGGFAAWDEQGKHSHLSCWDLCYLAPEEPAQPAPVEPPGYVHAQVLDDFAEDARTDKLPWLKWEMRGQGGHTWIDCHLRNLPGTSPDWTYRRKPQTRKVAAYETPMPMTEAPAQYATVWHVSASYQHGFLGIGWCGDEDQIAILQRLLARGELYRTEEDAQAATEAEMKAKGVAL